MVLSEIVIPFVSRSFLSCIELRGIGPPGPRADPRSRLVRPMNYFGHAGGILAWRL